MARRFTRGRGRLGSPRETSWLSIDFDEQVLGAPGTAITHTMTAEELAKRPFTVIRTHLEVMLLSDQTSASEDQLVAVGLCVVSEQAVAIGITAVPTPITDLDSDLWYVHQVMLNRFQFASGIGFEPTAGRRYSIDSKAMRKVNNDEEMILVQEVSALAEGAVIVTGGRMLIKEH